MQNYLWNYGDYYTRDKSGEYNKRLIAVGPQNKRESIGHRFCPDYYLDIDESDLIIKLFRAVSYVNSTRTDDHFYSALNEEVTRINCDINDCIKFAKEFCNRHNIKYNFPDSVYDNDSIYYARTDSTKCDFILDIFNNEYLKFYVAVRSLLN